MHRLLACSLGAAAFGLGIDGAVSASPWAQRPAKPAPRLARALQAGPNAPNWRTFPLKQSVFLPGIAAGPDRALWLSTSNPQGLLRIGTDGRRRAVAMPAFPPFAIATGADGRLWVSGNRAGTASAIAAVSTSGRVAVYTLNSPSGDIYYYSGLARGADGNVWLAEMNHLASVSPTGTITEYPYFFGEKDNGFAALTTSGNRRYVWYTVCCDSIFASGGFVGVIDTSTNFMTEWVIQNVSCRTPAGIAVGGDGMVYVPCDNGGTGPGVLARLNPRTNVIDTIGFDWPLYTAAVDTLRGPDGNIWMASGANGVLARYDIAHNAFDLYYTPDGRSPTAAAVGPDGNIWTVAQSAKTASVDVYVRNPLALWPPSTTLAGRGADAPDLWGPRLLR